MTSSALPQATSTHYDGFNRWLDMSELPRGSMRNCLGQVGLQPCLWGDYLVMLIEMGRLTVDVAIL